MPDNDKGNNRLDKLSMKPRRLLPLHPSDDIWLWSHVGEELKVVFENFREGVGQRGLNFVQNWTLLAVTNPIGSN